MKMIWKWILFILGVVIWLKIVGLLFGILWTVANFIMTLIIFTILIYAGWKITSNVIARR